MEHAKQARLIFAMPLGHTNCPVIDGWQGRLQAKLAAAGAVIMMTACCIDDPADCTAPRQHFRSHRRRRHSCWCCSGGAATETTLGTFFRDCCQLHDLCGRFCRCAVLPKLTALFSRSLLTCTCAMTVCQEASRLLRCEDSPANSIVAGAASGALLLGLQRKL